MKVTNRIHHLRLTLGISGACFAAALCTAAPAQAQLSAGTGFFTFDVGNPYATIRASDFGGIAGPGSLPAGIAVPPDLSTAPPVFGFMTNPNQIADDIKDLNGNLARLWSDGQTVNVIAFNKSLASMKKLVNDLLTALRATRALPEGTPEEAARKRRALDAIEAILGEVERIAPILRRLGGAIRVTH